MNNADSTTASDDALDLLHWISFFRRSDQILRDSVVSIPSACRATWCQLRQGSTHLLNRGLVCIPHYRFEVAKNLPV